MSYIEDRLLEMTRNSELPISVEGEWKVLKYKCDFEPWVQVCFLLPSGEPVARLPLEAPQEVSKKTLLRIGKRKLTEHMRGFGVELVEKNKQVEGK